MGIMALSWSRISDYRSCPHKFRLKYIDKEPNFKMDDKDKSPALVRGGNIHKQLEKYVVDRQNNLISGNEVWDPSVTRTIPLIDGIMENFNVTPERQIAINDKFEQVDWYSRDAWFRVIYDLVGFGAILLLGDYKTGKLTDYSGSMDELGQLHMSAVVGMALWPEYEKVSSIYIYVDHKKPIMENFDREKEFATMRESLTAEHAQINGAVEFPEKKNKFCCYCDATSVQCIHKRR